jgi:CBS domain-containing protein
VGLLHAGQSGCTFRPGLVCMQDVAESTTVHDVAEFMKAHEPFRNLDDADLDRLAERTKVESFSAGTVIVKQGEHPLEDVRVVRKGVVELIERGRVLDLLEEGEMFGQAWSFAALPTPWEARAWEDTLCYALPSDEVVPFLGSRDGLRFVARSLLLMPRTDDASVPRVGEFDPTDQPAGALVREQPLIRDAGISLQEAARHMTESGLGSLLVRLDNGELGILTDRDLRSRVVAKGLSLETPVREVVTTPVFTVRADQAGADVLLAMLGHGIRHVPVLSASEEVVGVVTDLDLLAAQARRSFVLRRAISDAETPAELRDVGARLMPTVVALHQGGLGAEQLGGIISVVVEALVRRMIDLFGETAGPPPAEFAWLWLGSHGRREAAPSSDIDSGLVWEDRGGESARAYMYGLAEQVGGLLATTGFKSDPHGLTGAGPVMAHPAGEWLETVQGWLDNPTDETVMAFNILLDGRGIEGQNGSFGVLSAAQDAKKRPSFRRLLLRLALAAKPPTGFRRDIVVEQSGEHRGSFDIKKGGLLPIVGLARYAGLAAGATSTSTVSRLQAAGAAGILPESDARTLEEAWRLMTELRMEHQVGQLEAGASPDDYLDPETLDALTRRHLREAFRLVASTQKTLQKTLDAGQVWKQ